MQKNKRKKLNNKKKHFINHGSLLNCFKLISNSKWPAIMMNKHYSKGILICKAFTYEAKWPPFYLQKIKSKVQAECKIISWNAHGRCITYMRSLQELTFSWRYVRFKVQFYNIFKKDIKLYCVYVCISRDLYHKTFSTFDISWTFN